MSSLRLVCHVSAPDGEELPAEDRHPFNAALDELAGAIAEHARKRGIDPDRMSLSGEDGGGSLLTTSSDAPEWAAYFWVYLPKDQLAQSELLPLIIDHLVRAREAVPDAKWDVTLGTERLVWDDGRFRLPS
ncbi:MAG: hypothetical protein ABL973_00380 [Micropepsaceae bacterium]